MAVFVERLDLARPAPTSVQGISSVLMPRVAACGAAPVIRLRRVLCDTAAELRLERTPSVSGGGLKSETGGT
jgi:hypothetical protein